MYVADESKDGNVSTANIPVMRDAGTFGTVLTNWRTVESSALADITPASGTVEIQPGVNRAFINISSLPDQVGHTRLMEGFEGLVNVSFCSFLMGSSF